MACALIAVKGQPAEPMPTPSRSTWGRINHGEYYGVITWDLDRAFCWSGFSENEMAYLQQIREASWGEANRLDRTQQGVRPEARWCKLNHTKLSKDAEIPRSSLAEVRTKLIAEGVVFARGDGRVRINKQADEWINLATGKPRLSPQRLEFCRSVQRDNPGAEQARFDFDRERINPRASHQTSVAPEPIAAGPPAPRADVIRPAAPTPLSTRPDTERAAAPTPSVPPPRHPSPAPIEERPRGVLDPAETARGGGEAQPPAPAQILVSKGAEPWADAEGASDYRLLADAAPEPAGGAPRTRRAMGSPARPTAGGIGPAGRQAAPPGGRSGPDRPAAGRCSPATSPSARRQTEAMAAMLLARYNAPEGRRP